jgi:hypothetical protein
VHNHASDHFRHIYAVGGELSSFTLLTREDRAWKRDKMRVVHSGLVEPGWRLAVHCHGSVREERTVSMPA